MAAHARRHRAEHEKRRSEARAVAKSTCWPRLARCGDGPASRSAQERPQKADRALRPGVSISVAQERRACRHSSPPAPRKVRITTPKNHVECKTESDPLGQ